MMDSPARSTPNQPRRRSMSVRAMLWLVLTISIPMGWWARQAHIQRAAVARIEAAHGAVLYEFEIFENYSRRLEQMILTEANDSNDRAFTNTIIMQMKSGSKTPSAKPPPAHPWKDWARKTLGVDYVDSVTQVFAIDSDKLHDDDLALLADLPKLECLNLEHTPIGDPGMVHIGRLRGLKMLCLDPRKLTDAGFAHLERLDQLEHLDFCAPSRVITDADLARLKGMKKLRVLTIRCPAPAITDAGLVSLEKLTNLKHLRIEAPNVSPERLVRLRMTLPKTRILVMSENEYQFQVSHGHDPAN